MTCTPSPSSPGSASNGSSTRTGIRPGRDSGRRRTSSLPEGARAKDCTATYAAVGGLYYAAIQCNSNTDKTRRIAASTYLNLTKSFAGSFGTLSSLTVPVATAADVGPIVYAY